MNNLEHDTANAFQLGLSHAKRFPALLHPLAIGDLSDSSIAPISLLYHFCTQSTVAFILAF